jgi:hypothetical protein
MVDIFSIPVGEGYSNPSPLSVTATALGLSLVPPFPAV